MDSRFLSVKYLLDDWQLSWFAVNIKILNYISCPAGKNSQSIFATKQPDKKMKTFVAACLISSALAFNITSIKPLDFDAIINGPANKVKAKASGVPQVESVPDFSKEEGYADLILDL